MRNWGVIIPSIRVTFPISVSVSSTRSRVPSEAKIMIQGLALIVEPEELRAQHRFRKCSCPKCTAHV